MKRIILLLLSFIIYAPISITAAEVEFKQNDDEKIEEEKKTIFNHIAQIQRVERLKKAKRRAELDLATMTLQQDDPELSDSNNRKRYCQLHDELKRLNIEKTMDSYSSAQFDLSEEKFNNIEEDIEKLRGEAEDLQRKGKYAEAEERYQQITNLLLKEKKLNIICIKYSQRPYVRFISRQSPEFLQAELEEAQEEYPSFLTRIGLPLTKTQQLPFHLAKGAAIDYVNSQLEKSTKNSRFTVALYPGLRQSFVDRFYFSPQANEALLKLGATAKSHLDYQEEIEKIKQNMSTPFAKQQQRIIVHTMLSNPSELPRELQEQFEQCEEELQECKTQLQKFRVQESKLIQEIEKEAHRLTQEQVALKETGQKIQEEYQTLYDHHYKQIESRLGAPDSLPQSIADECTNWVQENNNVAIQIEQLVEKQLEQKAQEEYNEQLIQRYLGSLYTFGKHASVSSGRNRFSNYISQISQYLPFGEWDMTTMKRKAEVGERKAPFLGIHVSSDMRDQTSLVDMLSARGEIDTRVTSGSLFDITGLKAVLSAKKAVPISYTIMPHLVTATPSLQTDLIAEGNRQQQDVKVRVSASLLQLDLLGYKIPLLTASISKGIKSKPTFSFNLVAGE